MKASVLAAAVILGATLHGIDAVTDEEKRICPTCLELLTLARPFVISGVIDERFVEMEMGRVCAKHANLVRVAAACRTLKSDPRILRGWLKGKATPEKFCTELNLCGWRRQ